jgi:hypothetical protein
MFAFFKNPPKIRYIVKVSIHNYPEFKPMYLEFYNLKAMKKEFKDYFNNPEIEIIIYKVKEQR